MEFASVDFVCCLIDSASSLRSVSRCSLLVSNRERVSARLVWRSVRNSSNSLPTSLSYDSSLPRSARISVNSCFRSLSYPALRPSIPSLQIFNSSLKTSTVNAESLGIFGKLPSGLLVLRFVGTYFLPAKRPFRDYPVPLASTTGVRDCLLRVLIAGESALMLGLKGLGRGIGIVFVG